MLLLRDRFEVYEQNLFACVQEVIIVCVWLIHSSLEGVFSKAQVVLIRP